MEHRTEESWRALRQRVRRCTLCAEFLPLGPRPVVQWHPHASILIVGQAPGRRVHETGIPFNDPSGDRLREWTGLSREQFYDEKRVALVPMGFCYPGTGKSGDLPPRPECAPTWHKLLLSRMSRLQLTLLIGQYAIAYHRPQAATNLTETVRQWRQYWPSIIPLPHPSPRNNLWLKRNPWLLEEVIPALRLRVAEILHKGARE